MPVTYIAAQSVRSPGGLDLLHSPLMCFGYTLWQLLEFYSTRIGVEEGTENSLLESIFLFLKLFPTLIVFRQFKSYDERLC